MYMQKINSSDFIQDVLTQSKPAIVLFHNKAQDVNSFLFMQVLKKYKESAPNMPIFTYAIDEPQNEQLAENLGVEIGPTLMVFKAGSLNRWLEPNKSGDLNIKNVIKFLGNPVLYGVEKANAAQLVKAVTASVGKKSKVVVGVDEGLESKKSKLKK